MKYTRPARDSYLNANSERLCEIKIVKLTISEFAGETARFTVRPCVTGPRMRAPVSASYPNTTGEANATGRDLACILPYKMVWYRS